MLFIDARGLLCEHCCDRCALAFIRAVGRSWFLGILLLVDRLGRHDFCPDVWRYPRYLLDVYVLLGLRIREGGLGETLVGVLMGANDAQVDP